MKKQNGFTLIELLVATTIIAVLIAVGTVSYTSVSRKSRDTKRKSDIEQVRAALEMYRADYGNYPLVEGDLESLSYIPKIPVDPKNVRYLYTSCGVAPCYTYTVQTTLEGDSTDTNGRTCTPTGTYNYCMKNP